MSRYILCSLFQRAHPYTYVLICVRGYIIMSGGSAQGREKESRDEKWERGTGNLLYSQKELRISPLRCLLPWYWT